MENPVAVLILGAVAVGWIVLRLSIPAKWQEFGFLAAIVLAVSPTLMGVSQDPVVHTVILPMAGGLVLGDLLHRVVQVVIVRTMALHRKAIGRERSPAAASENLDAEAEAEAEARARRRARRARAQSTARKD